MSETNDINGINKIRKSGGINFSRKEKFTGEIYGIVKTEYLE